MVRSRLVRVGHARPLGSAVEGDRLASLASRKRGRTDERPGVAEGGTVIAVVLELPPAAQGCGWGIDRQRDGHDVGVGGAVVGVVGEAVGTAVAGGRGVGEAAVGVERQVPWVTLALRTAVSGSLSASVSLVRTPGAAWTKRRVLGRAVAVGHRHRRAVRGADRTRPAQSSPFGDRSVRSQPAIELPTVVPVASFMPQRATRPVPDVSSEFFDARIWARCGRCSRPDFVDAHLGRSAVVPGSPADFMASRRAQRAGSTRTRGMEFATARSPSRSAVEIEAPRRTVVCRGGMDARRCW